MDKNADIFKLVAVKMEDIDLLFDWVNDSECRENAFDSKKIEYSQHKKWFINKLNNGNCKMYLYIYNDEYIGQVRIEFEESTGIIDYSIKREFRGMGHGVILLRLLEDKYRELNKVNIICLEGKVKISNLASQKVFEKLGYVPERKSGYISYKKILSLEE